MERILRVVLGCLVLVTLALLSLDSRAEEAEMLGLVPLPKSLEMQAGAFLLAPETEIVASHGASAVAETVAEMLRTPTGYRLPVVKKAANPGKSIRFLLDPKLSKFGAEGYRLEVTPQGVRMRAASPVGLFYAGQTLRQLFPEEIFSKSVLKEDAPVWRAPALKIEDEPRFAWRAFMLDEARHFQGMEVVKMLLDQMASLKMNVFHWHLVDDQGWRIEIKKYPRLTGVGSKRKDTQRGGWHSKKRAGEPHEGFYTQDQIREIVKYAAKRQITIVPEIEMPGHASASIAAYPELGTKHEQIEVPVTFGKKKNCYNVADENVYRMLNDILDEVAALFPGPVIHVGGDEVNYKHWKQSPDVKDLMKREGLKNMSDVQTYFVNRISHDISDKGRRTMGWNEIIGEDSKPNRDGKGRTLSSDAIIHFWKGNSELAKKAIEKGHKLVNSWNRYTYLDYNYRKIPLQKAYEFNPIFKGLDPQDQDKILGTGCQMWGEWIPTLSDLMRQVFPRLAAYAEVGWTPQSQRDFGEFFRRMQIQKRRWEIRNIEYFPRALSTP